MGQHRGKSQPSEYRPFDAYSDTGMDKRNSGSFPVPDEPPSLKGAIIGVLTVFLFVAFLVGAFLLSPLSDTIHNNRSLDRLESSFAQLKHPPQSALVRRESDIGLLIGNSDHCDFFVGELRSYAGSQQQITNFYKSATVWSPISGNRQRTEIVFLKQGAIPPKEKEYLPNSYQTSEEWSLRPEDKNKQLYIVYFLDVGSLNAGCDLRCF